ncbi:MAG TPA: Rad52/Rad22 family DNA repair protein [Gemmatimonadaceae bacterium]
MIARHETALDGKDLWARLAAPVPAGTISWRQDGRAVARDGKYFARFVCYIDANTVRERLDSVVPGEWDLTLELLPALPGGDEDSPACSFKARLQVLGVIREDVGTGRDYKSAATDAFKRAAVRFGIGHELYAFEQNWVAVDGEGRYAKPLEDPAAAYARRHGTVTGRAALGDAGHGAGDELARATEVSLDGEVPGFGSGPRAIGEPSCPKCGGRVWDNRATKRNPRAPDYRCRQRACDGVIWPAKGEPAAEAELPLQAERPQPTRRTGTDDIPF